MSALVKPKKLKLTDYEIFQTLGTGMDNNYMLRIFWKSSFSS